MTLIYKVCARSLWEKAEETGVLEGAPVDLRDGYIHFSTARQVRETVSRHFAGQTDLVLVAVGAEKLGDALRYEPSRDGDLFPHLYGILALSDVLWVRPLPVGDDGRHIFPDLIS